MGFSGSKISGHSGTSFKHRKGFDKILKHYEQTRYTYEDAPQLNESIFNPKESKFIFRNESSLKREKVIYLMIVTTSIIISVFLFHFINDTSDFDIGINSKSYQERLHFQKEIDYVEFTHAGFDNLKRNKLNNAQLYFSKALEINQCGKKARIGLTKVLVSFIH